MKPSSGNRPAPEPTPETRSNPHRERRRIKLIKPRLQLRLIAVFLGLSGLGFLLQSLHVGLRLTELAATVPQGGSYIMALMPELPLEILLVSFGMFTPLIVAVGIIVTFRIAGPVYRFEKYLRSVADGEEVRPCTLRKGDQLLELCELINEVTEPIRRRTANGDGAPELVETDEEEETLAA